MTTGRDDTTYERWGRRLLDVSVAGLALILLLPLQVAVAVAVAVSLGRPVLYCQTRAGRHGVPFVLRKFRTMCDRRDASGALLADDDRMTPLGRILRQCSLDELPQLVHVLTGEMSLVGPRPLPLSYVGRYTPKQARRLSVRPGLTGFAQVHGRNLSSWEERLAQDVWYVDHRSLALDARLLLATIPVVLTRQGVSHAGQATMHEFKGSAR